MRALVATLSAAVLGLSSLTITGTAHADSFSISFPDASFSWSDGDYYGYRDTPIYIVTNDWTPPRGYYRRHHDRDHRGHGHRHGHKHYRGHKRGHHKHHKHGGHDKHRW